MVIPLLSYVIILKPKFSDHKKIKGALHISHFLLPSHQFIHDGIIYDEYTSSTSPENIRVIQSPSVVSKIVNPDKYQELIIRRAVKAANKKRSRTQKDLDLGELRELKVATASPLSRLFVGAIGSTLLGSMIYLQIADGFFWLFTLFAVIGLYLLVVAIRGRKKRISEIENGMDLLDLGGTLVEAIIENTDFNIDL